MILVQRAEWPVPLSLAHGHSWEVFGSQVFKNTHLVYQPLQLLVHIREDVFQTALVSVPYIKTLVCVSRTPGSLPLSGVN